MGFIMNNFMPFLLGGFDKLSASYLLLPDELKKKKQVIKEKEKKAFDFSSAIENIKNKIMPVFPKKQQSNNAFIINSSNNNSGGLTNLGSAGIIGSGIAGLGGLAANRSANFLQNKLNSIDPYTEIARTKADNFVNALAKAKNPSERLLAYTEHGSDLMGSKLFNLPGNKQMSGRSFMQTLYDNPVLNKIVSNFTDKPDEFKWSPTKAQHYGSFSRGPVKAYTQLLKEIEEFNDPTKLLSPLKDDYRQSITNKLDSSLQKFREQIAVPGLDEKRRNVLQNAIDSIENAKNTKVEKRVNEIVGKYMKRYGAQTFNNIGEYHGAGLGYQLEQLAKKDPELIAKYPKLVEGLKVTKLDPKDQMKLLKQFTDTEYGQSFAKIFENKWKNPTSQYSTLTRLLTAPKTFIDSNKNKLMSIGRGGRNVALASLPLMAAGFGLRSLGKQQDLARSEQSNDLLIKKIMAALDQNKTENALPKYAAAYLLPPSKPKKKKLQSEQTEAETLSKQAAVYAKEAFLLQQYEMQQHLALNDFGNGWHP